MDRAVLQKVSDRWNDYGFKGASPVADMIPRLTRPEAPKKAAAK
jgi:4-hydroxy-3-polyprenylbenzoate decarboxylase